MIITVRHAPELKNERSLDEVILIITNSEKFLVKLIEYNVELFICSQEYEDTAFIL